MSDDMQLRNPAYRDANEITYTTLRDWHGFIKSALTTWTSKMSANINYIC